MTRRLGNVLTTTDALNNVTTNTYDALGRLASSDGPASPMTRFVRDAHGNAISVTEEGGYYDGGNRVTLTKYDSHSHALQVTRVSADAQGNSTSSSSFQSFDARGQVSRQWQVVQGNSGATQTLFKGFKYDALGRTTHTYTPVGISSLSASSAALAAQQGAGFVDQDQEYNAFGEVISRGTNGYEARETYLYDNGGNLVRSYAAGQEAASSGKGALVTFTLYDLLGRQTVSIESDGEHGLSEVLDAPTADALSHADVRRTDYQRDVLGRAVQIKLALREGNGGGAATRPAVLQTFDRWGNTLSQSDPRSPDWVTHYQYNAFNQVVQRVQPVVGTLGSGEGAGQVTPTTEYFTDALGRQIAERDANGNLNGKMLDAAGRITREMHADGGNVNYAYNSFGDRTQVTDAMGYVTKYTFDQQGRQTEIINDSLETYALSGDNVVSQGNLQIKTKIVYDQAGRVLSKTNGAGETTSFEYDARGNVIATTQPLGQVSRAAYDSQGNEIATQNLNGDLTQASYDAFGRMLSRTDIGGATISFTHDHAGQVTSKTSSRGQDIDYQYDNAGNLLHVTDNATQTVSHYEYDARGSRIFEQTQKNGEMLQNQTLGYDELGRLTRIDGIDGISVIRTYDAVGNVIQQYVQSNVPLPSTTEGMKLKDVGKAWTQVDTKTEVVIDPATGQPKVDPVTGAVVTREVPVYGWKDFKQLRNDISTEQGSRTTQTQYFAYDEMNRQILVDGAVNNNANDQANLTADQGHILTYDLNGNRTSDTYFGRQVVATARPFARDENGNILLDENGNPQYGFVSDRENEGNSGSGNGDEALGATYYSAQLGAVTQTYTYDRGNRIKTVSQRSVDAQGAPTGASNLLDTRKYDAAGRLIQTGPDGGMDANFVRALTGESLAGSGLVTKKSHFNANGQLERMEVLKADGSLSYNVYYDQQDAMGNVTQYRVVDHKNVTQTYTRTYGKYDGYVETAVHGVRSDNTSRPSDSASTYDVNGNLIKVSETHWPEDNPKATAPLANLERFFSNDTNGIILKKEQEGNVLKQLVVNNNVVTSYGKGVDSDKPYDEKGKTNYVAQGEFGLTFKAINSRSAAGSTNYTIRDGDTLSSIALNVWGDASLWWKIADANGLAATGPNDGLTKGHTVTLPGQVGGVHNNAETFKPYDPSEVVGDTTPNMPAPPPTGKGGCGIIGKIIMIVVAVVVTFFTLGAGTPGVMAAIQAGATAAFSGTAGALAMAGAAAVGSIASQAVGIAIGAQESFSWKAVALSAVSAGVSAGVASFMPTNMGMLGTALSYAASNAITQGVAVATGLQKKFDWKGVAGAAVGGAVSAGVGQMLGASANTMWGAGLRSFASGVATGLVGGGKVSITQVAVNAFGAAIGQGLANTSPTAQEAFRASELKEQKADTTPQETFRMLELQQQSAGTTPQETFRMLELQQQSSGTTPQETFRMLEIQQQNAEAGSLVAGGGLSFADDRAMRNAALDPLGIRNMGPQAAVTAVESAPSSAPAQPASYKVVKGDSYAKIARTVYGDERFAGLVMAANKVDTTYKNVHTLQVGTELNLPSLEGFDSDTIAGFKSQGGKLISADQRITDVLTAQRAQDVANRAAQAQAATANPATGPSVRDVEGYGQDYTALGRDINSIKELIERKVLTPEQGAAMLTSLPRANMTLRSDFEVSTVPANAQQMSAWDGVARLSPVDNYARGGLSVGEQARLNSLDFRYGQNLSQSLAIAPLASPPGLIATSFVSGFNLGANVMQENWKGAAWNGAELLLNFGAASALQKAGSLVSAETRVPVSAPLEGVSPQEWVTLFHGTNARGAASIRATGIDLAQGSPYADFGRGYYMTMSREESLASAMRHERFSPGSGPYEVLEYRVPKSEFNSLSRMTFGEADSAWQEFVVYHKTNGFKADLLHGGERYDVVTGPLYKGGLRSSSGPYPFTDRSPQISIHTQEAADMFNMYLKK
ncbi:MAG TPA: DUF3990 domain-containing protein [Ensifer sp.]|uniref:DUF3990 domain-containing protein n=1 Tax=Ensifer sp. TaxID=1872086 RepID=UPI002E11266F|nr:DUF3990 domain-containing protein [Ensifer sp.]